MVCDHIEIAEKGRKCEVCHLVSEGDDGICPSCSSIFVKLQEIQGTRGYGSSLVSCPHFSAKLGKRSACMGVSSRHGFIDKTPSISVLIVQINSVSLPSLLLRDLTLWVRLFIVTEFPFG